MTKIRFLVCSGLALLALSGCRTPPPDRAGETQRFRDELQKRLAELKIDPAVPMTADRCVEIAMLNSLDQRVRLLRAGLKDDQVKQSLSAALPKLDLNANFSRRDRDPLMDMGWGGPPIAMEDRQTSMAALQLTIPVVDWGTTYFAWQIANDRRRQEWLTIERSRQQLNRDVRIAYVRLAAAQRQERMGRLAVVAAQEMVRMSRSLEREGLGARASTASVEAGQAQAVLVWTGLRRSVEQARLQLLQLMSLPAGVEFAVDDRLPGVRELPEPATLPQFADRALAFRPELYVQDQERAAAASGVKKAMTEFLPHLNLVGSANWSSSSRLVDSTYCAWGAQLSQSLLNGGANWWNYTMAKQTVRVEEEKALLLSMSILYEVDFGVLQLLSAHDVMDAQETVAKARFEEMKMISSRYRLGLETGSEAARSLANLYMAYIDLDANQANYQVAWLNLETAAPPVPPALELEGKATAPVPVAPLPAYKPAPAIGPYGANGIPEAFPGIDMSQYPEIEKLMNDSGFGDLSKPR